MNIGIDIRVLGNRLRSGVEEYIEQLLTHMLSLDRSIHFTLFYSSLRSPLPLQPWFFQPNVAVRKFKWPNDFLFGTTWLTGRPRIDRLLGDIDVFFSPHILLSGLSPACKRVTTFHDLSFERFPEFLSTRRRIWHRQQMKPKWQARFSDKIIAVSEATKRDLVELYGIDPSKIPVIYSGVTPVEISEKEIETFRKEKKLPMRYIFTLSKLEPRKNIVGTLRAFHRLVESPQFSDMRLVIAGGKGWQYEKILDEIDHSPFRRSIILLDHITDSERPWYYQASSLFVYPSFFEGFGFPPLEAMAQGVPVITSRNSSLPEIAGDAGLLVNPYSVAEIASAMKSLLSNNNLYQSLSQKSRKRAAQFTWRKAAERTLEILLI